MQGLGQHMGGGLIRTGTGSMGGAVGTVALASGLEELKRTAGAAGSDASYGVNGCLQCPYSVHSTCLDLALICCGNPAASFHSHVLSNPLLTA